LFASSPPSAENIPGIHHDVSYQVRAYVPANSGRIRAIQLTLCVVWAHTCTTAHVVHTLGAYVHYSPRCAQSGRIRAIQPMLCTVWTHTCINSPRCAQSGRIRALQPTLCTVWAHSCITAHIVHSLGAFVHYSPRCAQSGRIRALQPMLYKCEYIRSTRRILFLRVLYDWPTRRNTMTARDSAGACPFS
jgi:hypothetical protein